MKKVFLISILFLVTGILMGQSTDKSRQDLQIYKPNPAIFLNGNGALINFNNGDLTLIQSSNLLTLAGGNLALGTNSLTLTGSIGATGARVTKGWLTNLEITNLPTIGGNSIHASPAFTGATTATSSTTGVALTINTGRQNTSSPFIIKENSVTKFSIDTTGNIVTTGSLGSTSAGKLAKGWFIDIESTNLPTISGASIHASPAFTGATTTTSSTSGVALTINSGRQNPDNLLNIKENSVTKVSIDTTGNILTTGSLGATGTRVVKGWFTNMEITNLPTINGESLSALYTSGNISIGANSLLLTGSIASTGSRATKAWATEAELNILALTPGDTTVTAVKGIVVFKTTDSTYYGCRSTYTNHKKWFPFN